MLSVPRPALARSPPHRAGPRTVSRRAELMVRFGRSWRASYECSLVVASDCSYRRESRGESANMAASSRQKNRALQAEKAAATRRRIVTAAASQFVHYGYLSTTMADIAREAGVAVRTVYL